MSMFSSVSKGQISKAGRKSCSLPRHLGEGPPADWGLPTQSPTPSPRARSVPTSAAALDGRRLCCWWPGSNFGAGAAAEARTQRRQRSCQPGLPPGGTAPFRTDSRAPSLRRVGPADAQGSALWRTLPSRAPNPTGLTLWPLQFQPPQLPLEAQMHRAPLHRQVCLLPHLRLPLEGLKQHGLPPPGLHPGLRLPSPGSSLTPPHPAGCAPHEGRTLAVPARPGPNSPTAHSPGAVFSAHLTEPTCSWGREAASSQCACMSSSSPSR